MVSISTKQLVRCLSGTSHYTVNLTPTYSLIIACFSAFHVIPLHNVIVNKL